MPGKIRLFRCYNHMGLVATKHDSNPQLKRLARKFKFCWKQSLNMILSKMRITRALIRLRGCAGWSAPLLFANPEDRFFSCRGPCDVTYNFIQNHNYWKDLHQIFSYLFETFGSMSEISFLVIACHKKYFSTAVKYMNVYFHQFLHLNVSDSNY